MKQDMKTIMTRLFMVIMLMMFSMGAYADVKVLFGENGDDVFSGKGGTIEVSQEPDEKDETKVIVTLTVTPKKNYSISKDDIKVYAVLPASVRSTRGLEISNELTLDGKDPQNLSEKRDYTVTIDSKLGLWVRTAVFTNTRKGVVKTTSKFYFIANNASYNSSVTTNNYYFVPAADPHQAKNMDAYYSANYTVSNGDPETPFITTFKTDCDNNSIWEIISFYEEGDEGEDDEYLYSHIKHWATGKYLIYEPPHSNAINRKCVHLQTTTSPGENARFDIITNGTGVNIRPISLTSGNQYLNPASGNKDFYYGQGNSPYYGGMVGVWSEATANSIWHLDETIEPPSFTVNADGTVEILSATGTTIYYTTNGNNPTTSDGEYTGAITVTSDMTAIKAIAVRTSDSKTSNVVTLPLQTYTYYIVNRAGDIAVKCELKQAVGKTLNSYLDIPAAIQSPYLNGETVKFYSFSEAYSSTDQLSDENQITETPEAAANIYVTYTTDHLSEKFLKLRGASAFNITADGKAIYDDSGSLASETTDYSSAITTANHLWNFLGEDPYAVQIQNFDTDKYLVFSTPPTLSLEATATNNFILMAGSASGDGTSYEQINLMAATGTGTPDLSTIEIRAYPVSSSVTYHLIDKAGKLIVSVPSTSSELVLPSAWQSPLVSEYHYYKDATLSGNTIGSSCDFTGATTISSPFDVGNGGNIYVTYDVSDVIDLSGTDSYLLKFSGGEEFHQEDGHDGINKEGYTDYDVTEATKAVYPYNNGDFNLYVYGQEQWVKQLSDGASTRTRWLWKFISRHNGTNLTGTAADPYHVVVKSHQDHTVKDKDLDDNTKDKNYGEGHSYLQTYKPSDYSSVITNIAYENATYSQAYPEKMKVNGQTTSMVNGQPTEYMILGTSLLSMTLKTFNEVEGERRVVNSFEQYWKNHPTVKKVANEEEPAANNATLTGMEWQWHQFTSWAYSAPWGGGSKALAEGEHWYQTISMGSEFTVEEVSLEPQVILLDQHGWEVMRVPLSDTETLRKYDSPMVQTYHWYPTAEKVSGYHKYRVSNQNIPVYNSDRKVIEGQYFTHNYTTLTYTPYDYFETIKNEHGWDTQDDRVKSDFYVTYTVKPDYANAYSGAATADATEATPFLLKQGGNYAKTENGSTITTTNVAPARLEDAAENMQWNLRPNFNIDHEMGYKYAGETGAQDGALSKDATEADYMTNGQNGFDPYNVQIQSKAYPQRYFTTNTSGSALDGGVWSATTSSSVNLQNQSTKQTATGYDQTTLNITNATFMVVQDANGNMRLMPRFDHGNVVTNFTALSTQTDAASAGDTGTGTQTVYTQLIPNPTVVHNRSQMTAMNGYYLLDEDFSFDGFTSLGTAAAPFTGTIDGQLNTLDGLTVPLVAYAQNAEIKNVILKGVTINSGYNNPDDENDANNGDTGAICCVAIGSTKIYNCGILPGSVLREDENDENKITGFSGSSVNGSRYVGSIVGFLGGSSRVINCYSYANIEGGSIRAGIVGYNSYASKYNDLKTMVMNCMFYGDIDIPETAANLYPIYGGSEISNDYNADTSNRLNNYNYFLYEAPYSEGRHIVSTSYNCALAAEERFLVRFEFYRHLLNSTRELAAWYATGNAANGRGTGDNNKMAKWVLDKSIAPYPILKEQGTYPSVVNYAGAPSLNKTLSVTISSVGTNAPDGSSITTGSLTLDRTDKDPANYNFNYDKVQLPYYNEVGTGNYTKNKVVTGWKITGFTNGTQGERVAADFTTSTTYDYPNYNFAERSTYAKDKYDISGRVFAQGAYFNVPEGVTAISIEPYWANAVYLSDACYDRYGYGSANSATDNLTQVGGGQRYTGGNTYSINGDNQVVYTTIANALGGLSNATSVYDNAVVLVGNYHHSVNIGSGNGDELASNKDKAFTIMSIDLNEDNEPDYSLIFRSGKQKTVSPIRYDFINVPAMAMAHKMASHGDLAIPGNCKPLGWFEITTTALMRYNQFEYDSEKKVIKAPTIMMGGVIEQFVSTNGGSAPSKTNYLLFGDNVWFKVCSNGCHMEKTYGTPHIPISITGGDYEKFYLSGYFAPKASAANDNAEGYIDGGRFGEVAGGGQEEIKGNVTWLIDHADIDDFYAGGINAAKAIKGDISTTIKNSHVGVFCGGPKFGDMASGKTIGVTATNCTFGTYFGAGFGGTSSYKHQVYNVYQKLNYNEWNTQLGTYYKNSTRGYYKVDGDINGILYDYEYELFGGSTGNVHRLYMLYASFSMAKTNNASSTLTGCTVTGNFYGAGSLGAVVGNVTSTLDNTTVQGSVFGAGYSVTVPKVDVRDPGSFNPEPSYNETTAVYVQAGFPNTTQYEWTTVESLSSGNNALNDTGHTIKTTLATSGLGSVTGNVTLTLKGNTKVGTIVSTVNEETGETESTLSGGNVFGGGESSSVIGAANKVTVNIQGNTEVLGNVFGGGDKGFVEGSTEVNLGTPPSNNNGSRASGGSGEGTGEVNIKE